MPLAISSVGGVMPSTGELNFSFSMVGFLTCNGRDSTTVAGGAVAVGSFPGWSGSGHSALVFDNIFASFGCMVSLAGGFDKGLSVATSVGVVGASGSALFSVTSAFSVDLAGSAEAIVVTLKKGEDGRTLGGQV